MLALLLSILLSNHLSHHASAAQPRHVFLLAGQSNMSGRGGVANNTWDGVVPPESRPRPSILRLTAGLAWVAARDPLHWDIDVNATCGVGPGMAFTRRLLETRALPGGEVGLVPCAVGGRRGTKISEWARGGFLYEQLLRRARAAARGGGAIRALLWYQGESDTVREEDASSYEVRLKKFFSDFRADLRSPELPVVQVALASGQGPYVDRVREAQLGLRLPSVTCVDAKGLQLQLDRLHLTTPAQVSLGIMMADAFVQIKPAPRPIQSGVTGP